MKSTLAILFGSAVLVLGTGPPPQLTVSSNGAFKVLVFSDLNIDNDGSNYAYTMQMIQNAIDIENNPTDPADTNVDLVVLMGTVVDADYQD
jgi:hypothetical protein